MSLRAVLESDGARDGHNSLTRMDFVIRPYAAGDRDGVLGLAPRVSAGIAPWLDRDQVNAALIGFARSDINRPASNSAVVSVAESANGLVVGFATAEVQSHWSSDRQLYIGLLAVSGQVVRAGAGRALVEHLKDWARKRGVHRFVLDTGVDNHRAPAFYARLGFEEEAVRLSGSV